MKLTSWMEILEASGAPCLFVGEDDEIKFVSQALKDQVLHAFAGIEGKSFYDAFELPPKFSKLEDLVSSQGPQSVKLFLKQDNQLGVWKVTRLHEPRGFVVSGEIHYAGLGPRTFEGIDDFVQYSREGFLKTKFTGEIMDANPRVCEILGYTRDELLKLSMTEIMSQPDRRTEMIEELRKKGYSKGKVFSYIRKDGSLRYCEISNILINKGGEPNITGYIVDVTDRVLAEKEAQKAQDLIQRMMVSTKDALYVRDLEGRVLLANPALADLVGVPLEELLSGRTKLKLPFEGSTDHLDKSDRIVIDKGGTITETEEVALRDGRSRVFHITRAPLRDNDGNIFAVFGVARDITENHRLRMQLEESFERFKVFIEEIPFAVAMFDRELNYVTSSKKWREDFHGDLNLHADLHGLNFFDIFPLFHDLFSDSIKSCLQGKTHASDNDQYVDKEGVKHYLRWSMVPWSRDDQVMGFILMIEDLDSEMEMEAALQRERAKSLQNSKMAALGEMATAIAHEINNPMAIIQTSNDLIRQCLLKDTVPVEAALKHVERVRKTVERVSKNVKSLKNVSRDSFDDPPQPVTVMDILEDSTFLHREKFRLQLIKFEVKIKREYLEQVLFCKPVQVAQIIINLLSNAQDAVASVDKKWIAIHGSTAGNYFEFRISDSGPGVAPELRERIFEPFYTSKSFGQGTGLGLSISRELAADQNCELYLDEKAPHTTFVLRVPLHRLPKPQINL